MKLCASYQVLWWQVALYTNQSYPLPYEQITIIFWAIYHSNYRITGASNHDVSKILYLDDPDSNGVDSLSG